MSILVTGGSGFLGAALTEELLGKGHRVYSLSRHPPKARENLIPLVGDIAKPNLGLGEGPEDLHAVHHLAAIHRLGEDKDGSIWRTNIDGTKNVLAFCIRHDIPHLYFTSTAYTQGRNTYERSKALCELMAAGSDIPKVTIFKPSIVLGTPDHPYPGHFSQLVSLIVKILNRAGTVKEKLEGTLRLPVWEPLFRIKGNPEGKLNLVTVDTVARAMAEIEAEGIFWLTNPYPPSLKQLVDWVGELIMVNLRVMPDFKSMPIEVIFQKKASAFEPYLYGDDFPSDLKGYPPITREFIHEAIKRSLQA